MYLVPATAEHGRNEWIEQRAAFVTSHHPDEPHFRLVTGH